MAALLAEVLKPKDPIGPSSFTSGSMWHHVFLKAMTISMLGNPIV